MARIDQMLGTEALGALSELTETALLGNLVLVIGETGTGVTAGTLNCSATKVGREAVAYIKCTSAADALSALLETAGQINGVESEKVIRRLPLRTAAQRITDTLKWHGKKIVIFDDVDQWSGALPGVALLHGELAARGIATILTAHTTPELWLPRCPSLQNKVACVKVVQNLTKAELLSVLDEAGRAMRRLVEGLRNGTTAAQEDLDDVWNYTQGNWEKIRQFLAVVSDADEFPATAKELIIKRLYKQMLIPGLAPNESARAA